VPAQRCGGEGHAMRDIPEDWEIVSRKIESHWIATIVINIIFSWLLNYPEIISSVTWTIRQKSTGITKRVTANSECEAADMIAKAMFGSD
jgi:hypothetical protein